MANEPKELLVKNVPADLVDRKVKAFSILGATNIKKVKNPDGTYNIEGTFPD
jgi:hypothetical protein